MKVLAITQHIVLQKVRAHAHKAVCLWHALQALERSRTVTCTAKSTDVDHEDTNHAYMVIVRRPQPSGSSL